MANNFIQGAMGNAMKVQADPHSAINNAQKAFAGGGNLALKLTALIDQEEQFLQKHSLALEEQVMQGERDQEAIRNHDMINSRAEDQLTLGYSQLNESMRRTDISDVNADADREVSIERNRIADKRNEKAQYNALISAHEQNKPLAIDINTGQPNPRYKLWEQEGRKLYGAVKSGVLGTDVPTLGLPKLGDQQVSDPVSGVPRLDNPLGEARNVLEPVNVGSVTQEEDRTYLDDPVKQAVDEQTMDFASGELRNRKEADMAISPTDKKIQERLFNGKPRRTVKADGSGYVPSLPQGDEQAYMDVARELFNLPDRWGQKDSESGNRSEAKQAVNDLIDRNPEALFKQNAKLTPMMKKRAITGFIRQSVDNPNTLGLRTMADAIQNKRITRQDVKNALKNPTSDIPVEITEEALMNKLDRIVEAKKGLDKQKDGDVSGLAEDEQSSINEALNADAAGYNKTTDIKDALLNTGLFEGAINRLGSKESREIPMKLFHDEALYDNARFGFNTVPEAVKGMDDLLTGTYTGVTTVDTEVLTKALESEGITVDKDKMERVSEHMKYRKLYEKSKIPLSRIRRADLKQKQIKNNKFVKDYEEKYPDAKTTSFAEIMDGALPMTKSELMTAFGSSKSLTGKSPSAKNKRIIAAFMLLGSLSKKEGQLEDTLVSSGTEMLSDVGSAAAETIIGE